MHHNVEIFIFTSNLHSQEDIYFCNFTHNFEDDSYISDSHFWKVGPVWDIIWIEGDHCVVRLSSVVRQSELAHLYLSVTKTSVRDTSITNSESKAVCVCVCV